MDEVSHSQIKNPRRELQRKLQSRVSTLSPSRPRTDVEPLEVTEFEQLKFTKGVLLFCSKFCFFFISQFLFPFHFAFDHFQAVSFFCSNQATHKNKAKESSRKTFKLGKRIFILHSFSKSKAAGPGVLKQPVSHLRAAKAQWCLASVSKWELVYQTSKSCLLIYTL